MATDYLTACGNNSSAETAQYLSENSLAEIVAEMKRDDFTLSEGLVWDDVRGAIQHLRMTEVA